MDKKLTHKTISGIAYNSAGKISVLLLRLGASIILARNLTASDFGVVGFAMVIIGFLSRFNDLGVGSAAIQKMEMDRRDLSTAFSLKVVLSTLICGTCIALAPKARLFFNHPDIGLVIQVLATIFLISSFSFIPETILTRGLEYKKLSMANISSAIARSAIAIGLVLNGYRYWSLVWAEIGATLVQVVAVNYFCHERVSFQIDRNKAAGFISFGGKVFLTGLIVFLIFNADNLIIGTAAGPIMLGFYALAFNWGSLSCSIISESVHSVLFPAFSKTQTDIAGLKQAYLKVLEYVSMLGIMLNIVLIANAREILFYVLGRGTDKWGAAVTALEILSIYGIIRIILEPVGNVVLAMGKPGILLKANFVAGILEVSLLYFGLKYWGINGVAILVTAAYTAQYLMYLPFLRRECGIEPSEFFAALKPSLICGFVITLSAVVLGEAIGFSITSMVVKVVYCVGGYIALHGVLTKWRTFKEAKIVFGRRTLLKIRDDVGMEV